MSNRLFTVKGSWDGGFYELALELGPRSDERLRNALAALWKHPSVDGWFLDRAREPAQQSRCSEFYLETGSHSLGTALLPNSSKVVCGSCLVREDEGPDWLVFYLPMGSLASAYPVGGFPFGDKTDWPGPWRFELEDWLAQIGLWIAQSTSYRLGIIGFEASGQVYAAEIATNGIPEERSVGYLWPNNQSVVYHRRTAE